MSPDKLWRPGTEVPETQTRAVLCSVRRKSAGHDPLVDAMWIARWYLDDGRAPAHWYRPGDTKLYTPSPTFYWLPIDALTDILIAEHDIEAL